MSVALELFRRGQQRAAQAGLILVDTKYELGVDGRSDRLTLIDEVHTPDSSRYWEAVDLRGAPGRGRGARLGRQGAGSPLVRRRRLRRSRASRRRCPARSSRRSPAATSRCSSASPGSRSSPRPSPRSPGSRPRSPPGWAPTVRPAIPEQVGGDQHERRRGFGGRTGRRRAAAAARSRRHHGLEQRLGDHAERSGRAASASVSPTKCGSCPPTARPICSSSTPRRPRAGGCRSSSPGPAAPPTCRAWWRGTRSCRWWGCRSAPRACRASTRCSPSCRCRPACRSPRWPSARRARRTPGSSRSPCSPAPSPGSPRPSPPTGPSGQQRCARPTCPGPSSRSNQ